MNPLDHLLDQIETISSCRMIQTASAVEAFESSMAIRVLRVLLNIKKALLKHVCKSERYGK